MEFNVVMWAKAIGVLILSAAALWIGVFAILWITSKLLSWWLGRNGPEMDIRSSRHEVLISGETYWRYFTKESGGYEVRWRRLGEDEGREPLLPVEALKLESVFTKVTR